MDELEFLRGALPQLIRGNPFQRFNAHGVDVGPKFVAGVATERMALRFYVVCKLPLAKVPPARRVPAEMRFVFPGDSVERVALTDVIEAPQGDLLALPPGALHRPVPGGVRVNVPANSASGTFGGWVWDRTDASIVLLSNEHVFGPNPGAEIFQPSASQQENRIGQVKRSAMLIAGPEPQEPADCYNFVDAAIGAADTSDHFDLTVLEVGPAVYATETAALNMPVEKFGQITLLTHGRVTSVDYNTYFVFPGIGQVFMCDLMRIVPEAGGDPFQSMGDSGAIIFKQENESVIKPAVGLLFAGGGTGANNWGVACKIGRVFDALDLDVLCAGGFAAFFDALFAEDTADAGADALANLFRPVRERRFAFHAGLSRAVQERLRETEEGRVLAGLVDRHRAELLMLLVRDGDVRRAMIAALRPILRGAATTDALFQRRLTSDQVARLTELFDVVEKRASKELRAAARPFRPLLKRAAGRTIEKLIAAVPTRGGQGRA